MGDVTTLIRHGPALYATRKDQTGHVNINGPALVSAPPWAKNRLGNYYLYFSQHRGDGIWLASSDRITGEWRVYPRPVLALGMTHYADHIASPDVIIDEERREVRMYFHGGHGTRLAEQSESLATSSDGLGFHVAGKDLGPPYWRVFRHGGWWYALVMPGTLMRSADGIREFQLGGSILPPNTRHSAVSIRGDHAHVFYSEIGRRPEAIVMSRVRLAREWDDWVAAQTRVVLEPQTAYEGAGLPVRASLPGQALLPARELRDPAAHLVGNTVYVAYVAGGERCIALASAPMGGLVGSGCHQ
jgi:hypothetical protein